MAHYDLRLTAPVQRGQPLGRRCFVYRSCSIRRHRCWANAVASQQEKAHELLQYERGSGVEIAIPQDVLNQLRVGREDWNAFWGGR
jgi:hypothetical protein